MKTKKLNIPCSECITYAMCRNYLLSEIENKNLEMIFDADISMAYYFTLRRKCEILRNFLERLYLHFNEEPQYMAEFSEQLNKAFRISKCVKVNKYIKVEVGGDWISKEYVKVSIK